jgi:hypothetical protein
MDAESWFSFVPRSTSTKVPDNAKHKRRVSMLKQPNVSYITRFHGYVALLILDM